MECQIDAVLAEDVVVSSQIIVSETDWVIVLSYDKDFKSVMISLPNAANKKYTWYYFNLLCYLKIRISVILTLDAGKIRCA